MVKIMEERASLKPSALPVSFGEHIICQESKNDVQRNRAGLYTFVEEII